LKDFKGSILTLKKLIHMNRIDRLSAILILLQTKKIIKASDISERFDISLRTVYRDMKALNEAGVPIGAEVGVGYYLVEGYHLPPVMFTPEEAGSLIVAGKLVNSFSDDSIKTYYNLAVDKIKSVLPISHKDFIEQIDKHIHIMHNSFRVTDEFSNNYITTIQKAVSDKKCLEIEYFSKYKQEKSNRIIEPLGLCFYGYQWHLISYCRLRKDYRDFRLDRIKSLEIFEDCNLKAESFSIRNYFNALWERDAIYNATITFKKDIVSKIAQTKYYFGYYDEVVKNDAVEMNFIVDDYEYIASWLISLGDSIACVKPVGLENIMQEKVKILSDRYLKKK
jgi:predicted DNA-binding transcriptional regulator YafY